MPVGTVVLDDDTGETLGDLTTAGQTLLVAKGGKGGWGNQRFKSSTNRTPRQSGPGLPGEAREPPGRAPAARGRRSPRPAERGQVDADPRRVGRAPEGRGLSVHDAAPAARRGRRSPRTGAS